MLKIGFLNVAIFLLCALASHQVLALSRLINDNDNDLPVILPPTSPNATKDTNFLQLLFHGNEEKMDAQFAQIFRRIDADKDGQVTFAEMSASVNASAQRLPPGFQAWRKLADAQLGAFDGDRMCWLAVFCPWNCAIDDQLDIRWSCVESPPISLHYPMNPCDEIPRKL